MEKIKKKAVQCELIEHEFYCNNCNKYLGKSIEHEDGWYQEINPVEYSFFIDGSRYTLEGNYCDSCKEKLIQKLVNALEGIGFRKE